MVYRRARRAAHRPRLRRRARRRPGGPPRLSGRLRGDGARQDDPLVPGARQSRPFLDGLSRRQRLPAPHLCRAGHPQHRQCPHRPPRRRQSRLLHGLPRRAHALRRHHGDRAGRRLCHCTQGAGRRPEPPVAVESRVDERVLHHHFQSAGTWFRARRRRRRICLLHLRTQVRRAAQGHRARRHPERRRAQCSRLRARLSRSGALRLARA